MLITSSANPHQSHHSTCLVPTTVLLLSGGNAGQAITNQLAMHRYLFRVVRQPAHSTYIHCLHAGTHAHMRALVLSFLERCVGTGKRSDGKTWGWKGENKPIVLLKIPKGIGTWLLRGRFCSQCKELGEQELCIHWQ